MEFLLENPFLIIVLIAAISSFFRKKKETSDTRGKTLQRPEKRRPESPFEEAREIFKELSRPFQEEAKPVPPRTTERHFKPAPMAKHASKEWEQPAQMAITQGERAVEKSQPLTPVLKEKQETMPGKERVIREQQIIDGVIWAEILGPPRAKNRYRGKNSRS